MTRRRSARPATVWLRAALPAMLWAMLPPSASAERVAVRSGEHAAFSRLVLVLERPSDWSRIDDGREVTLRLARPDIEVDTSGIFRLIPRTRLAEARASSPGPGLSLTLACDCPVTVYEDRPGILVIDIADPPEVGAAPGPGDTAAAAPDEERVAGPGLVPVAAADLRDLFWRAPGMVGAPGPAALAPPAADAGAGASGREPPSEAGTAEPAPPADPPPAAGRFAQPDAEPGPDPATDAAADARALIASQIGRAAAEGLVRAAPVAPRAADRPETPEAALPGLRISTGTDLGTGTASAPGATVSASRCLPDPVVDVASWGDPDDPWGEIGRRRSAALGEFDRPDPEAVRDLARGLIHLGFGIEALATLAAFGEATGPETPLGALARIVDRGQAPEATALIRMSDCDGLAALWAVLASPALSGEEVVNDAAVLRGFSGLPLHLRRHLGPPLAERLAAAGLESLARGVLDAILRAPGTPGAALALAEARLALAAGATAEAAARLDPLARGTGATADDARLLLAETVIDRGGAPDPGLVADLEALLHERGAGPEAARIRRLVVLGHAALGDFDAAFAALPPEGDPPDGMAADVLLRLARDAPDPVFLLRAFARPDWRGGTAPPPLRMALADRFLDLGLPDVAGTALLPEPVLPEERTRLARIRLAQDRPAEALRLAADIDTAEAAALRGEALARLDDPAGAAAALDRADAQDALARLAWREGDWESVLATGLDAERRAAERILTRRTDAGSSSGTGDVPAGAADAEASLAAARALLAETEGLRQEIGALMDLHRPGG